MGRFNILGMFLNLEILFLYLLYFRSDLALTSTSRVGAPVMILSSVGF
jgi:hypothetical protein